MIGYGYGYGVNLGALLNQIPAKELATLWLDGTILEDEGDYYFVDKIDGNNVLINDYDFPDGWVKGFPYKSAATIDIFGQTGVPVVSLFQNFDYADTYFCRHVAQVVDANGVELKEPYVTDIVAYSEPLTGDDLTDANTYYSVPVILFDKTIKASDGDYSTIESSIVSDAEIGVFTNVYNETPSATYLNVNKSIKWIGIGLVDVKITSSADYVIRHDAAVDDIAINGIIVRESGRKRYYFLLGTTFSFVKSLFVCDATEHYIRVSNANFNLINIENSIFTGSVVNFIYDTGNTRDGIINIVGNLFKITAINLFRLAFCTGTMYFKNNKIIINNNTFNRLIESKSDIISHFLGNKINILNCADELTLLQWFSGSEKKIISNNINIAEITKTFAYLLLCSNAVAAIIDSNIVTSKLTGTVNAIHIYSYLAGDSQNVVVNKNKIDLRNSTSGFGILVGDDNYIADNLNKCDNVLVNANYVRTQYYYDKEAENSARGIMVAWNLGLITKNKIDGAHTGIVSKNDDNNNANITYNVIVNCLRGLFCKGANYILIINNTIINKTLGQNIFATSNSDIGRSGVAPKSLQVKNNILINAFESLLMTIEADAEYDHDIDYNIYFSAYATPFKINGVEKTFAEWQALGYDEHSIMLSTLAAAKALFVDYDNGNYALASGSAAIGAGIALDAAYDDGLDASTEWGSDTETPVIVTKQQSAAWDCGAYVH